MVRAAPWRTNIRRRKLIFAIRIRCDNTQEEEEEEEEEEQW
jgi:hypothetical protein